MRFAHFQDHKLYFPHSKISQQDGSKESLSLTDLSAAVRQVEPFIIILVWADYAFQE